MSIGINLVIVGGTWSLLMDSLTMSLNAVPPNVDVAKVRAFLLALPGVPATHDLHGWSLRTSETALTWHLVTPGEAEFRRAPWTTSIPDCPGHVHEISAAAISDPSDLLSH